MLYSDFFITCAYYWALFLMTFVVYVLVFEDSRKNNRYKKLDSYYIVKRLLAIHTINNLKRRLKKVLLITNENVQEKPRKLISDSKTNTQLFLGVDETGNSIFLKLVLQKYRLAEVVLILKINGKTYTFPNNGNVLICSTRGQEWQAGGLTISVLEPLRRLRLTFNGLLRRNQTDQVEHVKFALVWTCVHSPFYYPQDVPTALLSDALAKEPWRNGEWIKLLGDEKGYEQYGVLHGSVTYGSANDALYLQSFRKRYWGSSEHLTQRRDCSLFLIAEDGLAFNLGVKSFKKGCGELKYGSLLDNLGDVFPVSQHDINLECVGENTIPSNVVFHLRAKTKTYRCVASLLVKNAVVAKGNGTLTIVPCKFVVNTQQGHGFACFWQASRGNEAHLPDMLLTEPSSLKLETSTFVLGLSNRASEVAALSGEKGKYLALASSMTSSNFAVPEGFVVLTTAFDAHVKTNERLKEAFEFMAAASDDAKLAESCQRIANLLISETIDVAIGDAIMSEMRRISHGSKFAWAVRSSGVLKNGSPKFFSGCLENDVLQAVGSCWSSFITYANVQQCLQNGFDVCGTIAVVVQKIVPVEASGVVYSCHPTSGNPSEIVIEPNRNLEVPETNAVVVYRTWDGVVSTKTIQDGIPTRLSQEQTITIAEAAVELEKAFGFWCKIDWSFCDVTLYVLQIEPLTSIEEPTDDELLHEFDTPVMTKTEVQTSAIVNEIAPGALTPLTSSVVKDFLTNYWYRCFGTKLVGLREHHLVLNTTNSILCRLNKNALPKKRFRKPFWFDHLITAYKIIKCSFNQEEYLKECTKISSKRRDQKSSASVILETIEAALQDLNKIGQCYVRNTHNTSVQLSLLSKLAGNSNVATAQWLPFSSNFKLMHDLKRVSDLIVKLGLDEEFFKTIPSSGSEWLKTNVPEAHELLQNLLKIYGKRGVKEFELDCQTWDNNVDLIIEKVQFQCKLKGGSFSNVKSIANTKNYLMLHWWCFRRLLKFLSETCRKSLVRGRKLEWLVLDTVDIVRDLVKDLSSQMVDERLIIDSKLIYYFSMHELKNLVEHHERAAVEKARRRQKRFPAWDKKCLPVFIQGFSSHSKSSCDKIRGVFVGKAGNVAGRACVVREFSDFKQMLPGDVLITLSVNVSWEPFFSHISGLVTETSDIFSCGASAAKEYGFSCLVDAQGATLAFKTGDTVLISEKNSAVELLQ